jgi:Ca2+-binding EF-hand superfamily protein
MCGKSDTNALSNTNINALSTQEQKEIKFEEFWNSYPKKVKKKDAKRKFDSLSKTKQQLAIDALEKFKQTDQRKRGYIPDPTTYINQERREDEIETKKEKPNTLVYH